jgi:Tfp pilus assembly protein PilN
MRAVNLLPAPRVETRQDDGQSRARTTKAVAIAAGLTLAFVTAAVGFAFVHERSAANDRQSTLDSLQAKIAHTHAATASSAPVATKTQGHLAAITSAASGRMAWDRLLDQLARVMPPGASLETLQANDGASTSTTASTTTPSSTPSTSTTTSSSPASKLPSSTSGTAPATGAAPTGFVVTGNAGSQATVARALDRLALIPALSDVTLQSTKRADAAGKQALQFTIAATLRPTGGTPR